MYNQIYYPKSFLSEQSPSIKLAQAYVPIQKYVSIYPPEEALKKGTVFPELDFPYVGEKMR
ncbi:MAG: hypothetical protein XD49_0188 [Caldanaerobacter subterraneus]|jgi:hypothetical protein|uniref:Spore coat associated protein JA (CotJA) n=4 Tax=Caldanaerobacter subterraneus TaxID=911092 RepID=Q8R931_CALS4|nr:MULTISPECIES: spore coat associated protein CotJA [Caldanaerobacter]AAM24991.1 hypothetical protein TTE1799 [Caldanaerobacter subterraneus subsp. tengcongensis MB4]ERM93183.1 hypothetical protein O163_00765 [Caldanaerobacter subterraneus subsp. yonseiensis KB-1]KKC29345.1 hypothetical protein CDSM653_01664 [Caldanaerobacter subterraneus subsp. pacificus DSM 12653]KUK09820.1 MAG: hypothetical protein XD49_0188 [Caldanaerobacter subterraneus]MBE3578510.1 spore coat associated protein CotJA [C